MQSELNRIKTENDNLEDYRPPAINGVIVKYKSILSAIDGKVMNAFSNNNDCAACPFCKITWKDIMNDEKEIDFAQINSQQVENLAENICETPLHIIINCLVLCFKVGFRNIKGCRKYRKTMSPKQKARKDARKIKIRNLFRSLGYPIFDVRQGGRGNANDGKSIRGGNSGTFVFWREIFL